MRSYEISTAFVWLKNNGEKSKVKRSAEMHYKQYGKTGDKVSVLGFGAMRFPKVKGRVDIDFYHLHALRWDVYRMQLGPGKPIEQFKKAKSIANK